MSKSPQFSGSSIGTQSRPRRRFPLARSNTYKRTEPQSSTRTVPGILVLGRGRTTNSRGRGHRGRGRGRRNTTPEAPNLLVPKPGNLPSLRKEKGLDPNANIIITGAGGSWGAADRPTRRTPKSTSEGNAWSKPKPQVVNVEQTTTGEFHSRAQDFPVLTSDPDRTSIQQGQAQQPQLLQHKQRPEADVRKTLRPAIRPQNRERNKLLHAPHSRADGSQPSSESNGGRNQSREQDRDDHDDRSRCLEDTRNSPDSRENLKYDVDRHERDAGAGSFSNFEMDYPARRYQPDRYEARFDGQFRSRDGKHDSREPRDSPKINSSPSSSHPPNYPPRDPIQDAAVREWMPRATRGRFEQHERPQDQDNRDQGDRNRENRQSNRSYPHELDRDFPSSRMRADRYENAPKDATPKIVPKLPELPPGGTSQWDDIDPNDAIDFTKPAFAVEDHVESELFRESDSQNDMHQGDSDKNAVAQPDYSSPKPLLSVPSTKLLPDQKSSTGQHSIREHIHRQPLSIPQEVDLLKQTQLSQSPIAGPSTQLGGDTAGSVSGSDYNVMDSLNSLPTRQASQSHRVIPYEVDKVDVRPSSVSDLRHRQEQSHVMHTKPEHTTESAPQVKILTNPKSRNEFSAQPAGRVWGAGAPIKIIKRDPSLNKQDAPPQNKQIQVMQRTNDILEPTPQEAARMSQAELDNIKAAVDAQSAHSGGDAIEKKDQVAPVVQAVVDLHNANKAINRSPRARHRRGRDRTGNNHSRDQEPHEYGQQDHTGSREHHDNDKESKSGEVRRHPMDRERPRRHRNVPRQLDWQKNPRFGAAPRPLPKPLPRPVTPPPKETRREIQERDQDRERPRDSDRDRRMWRREQSNSQGSPKYVSSRGKYDSRSHRLTNRYTSRSDEEQDTIWSEDHRDTHRSDRGGRSESETYHDQGRDYSDRHRHGRQTRSEREDRQDRQASRNRRDRQDHQDHQDHQDRSDRRDRKDHHIRSERADRDNQDQHFTRNDGRSRNNDHHNRSDRNGHYDDDDDQAGHPQHHRDRGSDQTRSLREKLNGQDADSSGNRKPKRATQPRYTVKRRGRTDNITTRSEDQERENQARKKNLPEKTPDKGSAKSGKIRKDRTGEHQARHDDEHESVRPKRREKKERLKKEREKSNADSAGRQLAVGVTQGHGRNGSKSKTTLEARMKKELESMTPQIVTFQKPVNQTRAVNVEAGLSYEADDSNPNNFSEVKSKRKIREEKKAQKLEEKRLQRLKEEQIAREKAESGKQKLAQERSKAQQQKNDALRAKHKALKERFEMKEKEKKHTKFRSDVSVDTTGTGLFLLEKSDSGCALSPSSAHSSSNSFSQSPSPITPPPKLHSESPVKTHKDASSPSAATTRRLMVNIGQSIKTSSSDDLTPKPVVAPNVPVTLDWPQSSSSMQASDQRLGSLPMKQDLDVKGITMKPSLSSSDTSPTHLPQPHLPSSLPLAALTEYQTQTGTPPSLNDASNPVVYTAAGAHGAVSAPGGQQPLVTRSILQGGWADSDQQAQDSPVIAAPTVPFHNTFGQSVWHTQQQPSSVLTQTFAPSFMNSTLPFQNQYLSHNPHQQQPNAQPTNSDQITHTSDVNTSAGISSAQTQMSTSVSDFSPFIGSPVWQTSQNGALNQLTAEVDPELHVLPQSAHHDGTRVAAPTVPSVTPPPSAVTSTSDMGSLFMTPNAAAALSSKAVSFTPQHFPSQYHQASASQYSQGMTASSTSSGQTLNQQLQDYQQLQDQHRHQQSSSSSVMQSFGMPGQQEIVHHTQSPIMHSSGSYSQSGSHSGSGGRSNSHSQRKSQYQVKDRSRQSRRGGNDHASGETANAQNYRYNSIQSLSYKPRHQQRSQQHMRNGVNRTPQARRAPQQQPPRMRRNQDQQRSLGPSRPHGGTPTDVTSATASPSVYHRREGRSAGHSKTAYNRRYQKKQPRPSQPLFRPKGSKRLAEQTTSNVGGVGVGNEAGQNIETAESSRVVQPPTVASDAGENGLGTEAGITL